jgi:hypothetical protein
MTPGERGVMIFVGSDWTILAAPDRCTARLGVLAERPTLVTG